MMPCTVSGTSASVASSRHVSPSRRSRPRSFSIRMYSSAKSGFPSARRSSVCCISAGSTACERCPAIRRAVSSSESADSDSVSVFGLAPTPVRASHESSGRALQRTNNGTPVALSTRPSTKSSRPSSAQCRSSKTSTVGRCSPIASKKRRQAANASPRLSPPPPVSDPRPDEWPQVTDDPFRLGRIRRRARRPPPSSFRAASSAGSPLENAGLRLRHLAQRPVADPVAVGEAAALAPGDQLRCRSRRSAAARPRGGSCRSRARRRA